MTGRLLVLLLLFAAVIAGGGLYYLQVYGYYHTVPSVPGQDVQLVTLENGTTVAIPYENFQAIDAESSPIRYRACFTTSLSLEQLSETYVSVAKAEPRNAPAWFECFDSAAIVQALETGEARAFLGAKNIHYGTDRIVAITSDGRGYVWHDLNDCGDKAYDGTVTGEECPPRPGEQY